MSVLHHDDGKAFVQVKGDKHPHFPTWVDDTKHMISRRCDVGTAQWLSMFKACRDGRGFGIQFLIEGGTEHGNRLAKEHGVSVMRAVGAVFFFA